MKTSIDDYVTAAARRPRPTGRRRLTRAHPPRPADAPVREPDGSEVPDWSPPTLEKLAVLTPLEQAVVLWRATGLSGAEAYRRATGRDAACARQSAAQIFARPPVAAALAAALGDRTFDARCDRGLLLLKLRGIVTECAEVRTPGHCNALIAAIRLMAQIQGELPFGRSGRRRRPAPPPPPAPPGPRLTEFLAKVERLTTVPARATKPPTGSPTDGSQPAGDVAGPARTETAIVTPIPPAPPTPPPPAVKRVAKPAAPVPEVEEPAPAAWLLPRVDHGRYRYRSATRMMGLWG